ncbi:MAG TPA: hypothetical protein VHO69_18440 [Phototrophicaceae bacterium]|nr:hypothetical protein [Phototrophicaceae bacterium]
MVFLPALARRFKISTLPEEWMIAPDSWAADEWEVSPLRHPPNRSPLATAENQPIVVVLTWPRFVLVATMCRLAVRLLPHPETVVHSKIICDLWRAALAPSDRLSMDVPLGYSG